MGLPKIISQETYDQVVLENVIDFENSLEDAIKETISEFEAQGVQLSNIIKEVQLDEGGTAIVHPVLQSLETICKASESETSHSPALAAALTTFTEECKRTLAHRVMATKHGAYPHLLKLILLSKSSAPDLLPALQAMVGLCSGNPDVLDQAGADAMKDLMKAYGSDVTSDVMEWLAHWCRCSNFKHENNRQTLFDELIPGLLARSLPSSPSKHAPRVAATLQALRSFALDDDVRTEFGHAHEHARHLVEEEAILPKCFAIVKDAAAARVASLTAEALAALTAVTVRAEHCRAALDAGALNELRQVLEQFPAAAPLNKQCLAYLTAITGEDRAKREVVECGLHALIPAVMDRHQRHAGVASAACGLVSSVALRQPANAAALVKAGAGTAVLQAMKLHPAELQVQKMACLALRNLCSRSPETAAALRDAEAEGLVCAALQRHGEPMRDFGKSALRDLGAEVELVEQWLGRGHEIQQ